MDNASIAGTFFDELVCLNPLWGFGELENDLVIKPPLANGGILDREPRAERIIIDLVYGGIQNAQAEILPCRVTTFWHFKPDTQFIKGDAALPVSAIGKAL